MGRDKVAFRRCQYCHSKITEVGNDGPESSRQYGSLTVLEGTRQGGKEGRNEEERKGRKENSFPHSFEL